MVSKNVIGIGLLGIGAIAAAFVVSQGGGNGDGDKEKDMSEMKKEVLMSYSADAPVYSPVDINAPYTESNITKIIQNILSPTPEPAATPTPTPAPKKHTVFTGKITGGAGTALGYDGYVTPTTPTPVSPGYIPGVTTFKKYTKPAYIPSPVKPPSVSTKKTPSQPKKSTYIRRSEKGYTYSKTGSLTKK